MLNGRWLKVQIAILLTFTLFLLSCSEGTSPPEYLRGSVFSEKPVSGATLTIYDIKGKVIMQNQETATDDSGNFLLKVKNCPSDFRIVASKGVMDDQVFTVDLKADYRNFNLETDIIYINGATTIISAYLDKNPDKTLDTATQVIKNYLEIPESVNLASDLLSLQQYFSHKKFMEEASLNGGVTAYMNILIAEADIGKTHPFPGEVSNRRM